MRSCPYRRVRPASAGYTPLRLFQDWGRLSPRIAADRLLISVVEQRLHIDRIEVFLVLDCKIPPDIRKVVVYAVALCRRVDAQNVIVAAVMNHCRDRPARYRHQPPVHGSPLGVQPAAADDVSVALAGEGALPKVDEDANLRRVEKGPRHRPAVDVHFLVPPPPASTSNSTGGKKPGIAAEASNALRTRSWASGRPRRLLRYSR